MFPKQLTCVALAAMFAAAPLIASAAVAPRNAPSPVLIGYAHNWDEGDPYQGRGFDSTAPYIRLVDFPTTYNVLVVSFATGDAQSGTVYFKPKIQTPEEFKADVQAAKKQGRRVILSVGGADGSFPITSQNVDTFTKSLAAVIDEYDFDGIDIDLENAGIASEAAAVSQAMRTIRQARVAQNKPCTFSMAPEFPHLRHGFYVDLAKELADEWDWVLPQLYNQGGDGITAGDKYVSATNNQAAFISGIYQSLVTEGNANFPVSFSHDVFCICLPATNWAAGSGFATPDVIEAAVSDLKAAGFNPFCMATWSANWDATNDYSFARTAAALLQ